MGVAATVLLHAPLLFVTLKWPALTQPAPLVAIEVGLGLQQALEVALTKPKSAWAIQTFGLPTLLTSAEPPPVIYSSHVLIDAKDGVILWAKPHPLLSSYLADLRFATTENGPRLLSGYIATGPTE